MILTEEMVQLFAVALARDHQRITEALLEAGVLQFVSVQDVEAARPLKPVAEDKDVTAVSELRRRAEALLQSIDAPLDRPGPEDLSGPLDLDLRRQTEWLDQIEQQRQALRERQRSLHQELRKLEDIHRQIRLYGVDIGGLPLGGQRPLLASRVGQISRDQVDVLAAELKRLPVLNVTLGQTETDSHHLLVFTKRDQETLEAILNRLRFRPLEVPTEWLQHKENLLKRVEEKIETLRRELQQTAEQVDQLVRKEARPLGDLWRRARVQELCGQVEHSFGASERVIVFAGWLPAEKRSDVETRLRQACQGRLYLEWIRPRSAEQIGREIPVRFRNPKLLSPFQMLVSNFGIPEYGTLDPTVFVMPLYLAMFGLMFADLGQGLVLMILGALAARWGRNRPEHRNIVQLGWLITWCGAAAAVFGVLLGSCFGLSLFEPVWFDLHGIVLGHAGQGTIETIEDVLAITIAFGVTVILLGLLFNWINDLRTGRWLELVFDKTGLLGAWIYVGGVFVAHRYVRSGYQSFPDGGTLFWATGLPALLLFLKEPLHHVRGHHGDGERPFGPTVVLNWLMQWLVELLEVFSGYLSNTLSFMRVAGLGIAHVCLMVSFFTLADMVGGGVGGLVILILGNLLVIGLEGLSAGIQALRLNYYEFFTKFFRAGGTLHRPIGLNCELSSS